MPATPTSYSRSTGLPIVSGDLFFRVSAGALAIAAIGLVESLDGGATWALANNGLPAVAIFQMRIVDDEIVVRPVMQLAMSYDHRIIDGKDAVLFLVAVKEALEDPSRLLLGL